VADPVWAVLLRSRNCPGGHLRKLQTEAQCSVVVDRTSARIRVAGTTKQVEAAQAWLWRLHEDCDSVQVWLGPHVRAPEALASEAEARSLGVRVDLRRQRGGGCMARVQGLAPEVQKAVEVLRSAALQSPMFMGGSTTAGTDGLSETGRSSQSAGSCGGCADKNVPVDKPKDEGLDSGTRTPSDWGDAATPRAQVGAKGASGGVASPVAGGPGGAVVGTQLRLDAAPFTPSRDAAGLRSSAPSFTPQPHERPSRTEDGAMSLAERLAQQFPSARIIVGAPDEMLLAESQNPPGSVGRLELQMKRLKDLLEQDKARALRF